MARESKVQKKSLWTAPTEKSMFSKQRISRKHHDSNNDTEQKTPIGLTKGHSFNLLNLKPSPIQAKLTVGAPGDKYEQEADNMAAQVMSMPDAAVQREIAPEEQKEEEVQTKPSLQRATDGSFQAGGNIESQLNNSEGGGSPLGDEVRGFMEPRFGADFGSVRVHTGNEAVQMNRELGAQAFTHGSDVYFGAGKAPAKDVLTAHELTHVVQQNGSIQAKENAAGLIQRGDPEEEQVYTPADANISTLEGAEVNIPSNTLEIEQLSTPVGQALEPNYTREDDAEIYVPSSSNALEPEQNFTPADANMSTPEGAEVNIPSNTLETEQLSTPIGQALEPNYMREDGTEIYVPPSSNDLEPEQNFTPANNIDVGETEIKAGPSLNQHALLEQAAHVLAYEEGMDEYGNLIDAGGKLITDSEKIKKHDFAKNVLENAGYDVGSSHAVHGEQGFAMRSFAPTDPKSGVAPIVSFRGTEAPGDVVNDLVIADSDPDGVGKSQYLANIDRINKEMAKAYNGGESGGKVIVTGHSLGGALAQQAAIDNPDMTSKIETFQSARINNDDAVKIDQINKDRVDKGAEPITSTHHRVAGDIVPVSGENMTRGEILTYGIEGLRTRDPVYKMYRGLLSHLDLPVTTRAVQQGQGSDIPGADLYSDPYKLKPTFSDPTVTATDEDKGGYSEFFRRLVGRELRPNKYPVYPF